MSSSQLGQPILLKSFGVWTIEQRTHARSCFDLDCCGMAAMMVQAQKEYM